MRLLIINDEVLTARTMKREIDWTNLGVSEVYLAFNANEAKEQLQAYKMDILLCDIEMPGDSGIQLLRWVREQGMDCDCIFLTCHANFIYAQEALRLGCQDYVLMPTPNENVAQTVKKVVQYRKAAKEKARMEQYGQQWIQEKKNSAVDEQGEKKSPEQIVRECSEYILQNLENGEIGVNEVAEFCHLSPIYLNRIFKKEKHISISQYIISEKMELAAKLLKGGGLNANTVALKVGYPNYPHFSAAFKKYHGCSPKQFIEDIQSEE